MSIVDNLNEIKACKKDIRQAIVDKGVDMTNVPLSGYAGKIGEIQTGGQTEELTVTANGTYTPAEGVDGYSKVTVDVPQEVEGYTIDDIATKNIVGNITGSASFIGSYVFAYCGSLTGADFPNATIINNGAFSSCSGLVEVNIPNATSIGTYAFNSCSRLQTVNAPKLVYVGDYTFQYCNSLQSIDFPNATFIGANAFYLCPILQTINAPKLTSTGNYPFRYCSSLQSVDFPNLTSIGTSGFEGCSSLSEVQIPLVGSIGNTAFSNCRSLSSLTVGTELYYVPTLGTNVFSNTPMLNSTYLGNFGSIYVPISLVDSYKAATNWVAVKDRIVGVGDPDDIVLSFANNSLYGRYSMGLSSADLTRFGLKSTSALYYVDLPNVNGINSSTFTKYSNIQTVNLPNVTYISNYAFDTCSRMTTIDITNVETIRQSAFRSCYRLSEINIPNVTRIERGAFEDCHSLEKVYVGMNVSKVVSLGALIFTFTPMTDPNLTGNYGSIYVPASLVDAYKTALFWSNYKSRITAIPE